MTKYEPDKFIVINRKHLEELSDIMKQIVEVAAEQFSESRKLLGLKTGHKYYVCNQDEPYAQKVLKVILEGEREKERLKAMGHLSHCSEIGSCQKCKESRNIIRGV